MASAAKPQEKSAAVKDGITEAIVIASDNAQISSRPYFSVEITLNSVHSQKILTRGYLMAAEGMFSLSVILPAITDRQNAEEAQAAIYTRLTQLDEDIKGEHARLTRLAESNGVPLNGLKYTDARRYSIQVSTPRASSLIRTICELDKLIELLDTLWLMAIISEPDYNDAIYTWKRRFLRVMGAIRNAASRAMSAANRAKNKSDDETEEQDALSKAPAAERPATAAAMAAAET